MYKKFSLKQQIILPFLGVFFSLWSVGMWGIGYWSTKNLEENQKKSTSELAALILREFEKEAAFLRSSAELLAESSNLKTATEKTARNLLLKNLLSIESTLELDFIQVMDETGEILLDLRKNELISADLATNQVRSQVLKGVYLSSIFSARNHSQSILIGAAPIRDREGVKGAIVVGTAMNDNLLDQFIGNNSNQLVAFNRGEVIASTLASAKNSVWQRPMPESIPKIVKIGSQIYLGKTVEISRLNNAQLELVLLESLLPLQKQKQSLWLSIWFFGCIGGAIATVVGIWIANSIVARVQRLTNATQQLARGDFPNTIIIDGDDEIGVLARGFNFMSSQVLKRDRQIRAQVEELENILQELQSTQNQLIEQEKEYSQLLEIKVKQRTQELVSKNAQLKSTLKQLKAAQKQMIAQEKLASLGGLTAGIAHEIRNPLNFINNFAQLAVDLTREVLEEIENHKDVLDEETFSDLTEIIQDLETNVTKIEHHGHRAEKIVSSMLLHSRGGPGNWQPVNLNDLLAESINLAYHGMRAKDILFNATIETYYDYKIPELTLIPQDINRVFLNIINNACYAVNLKKKEEIGNFSPLIRVTSKNLAETVEVKIWDNGVGIPPEEIERIFEHFYTTKPTGEGTGLGLSLSYEIIVERHLGKIDVRSELGEYTEFTIAFPKKEIKNTKI